MMRFISDMLRTVVFILCVLLCIAAVVVGSEKLFGPRLINKTETAFKAACSAVNGTTVWNGRSWECIK